MAWQNLLEPETDNTRREVLTALGTTGTTALAGCGSDSSESGNGTGTSTATETPTETETEEGTPTPTPTPEPTYPATYIEESGTLNLKPVDPDAEYADSIIFKQYNGEIDVKLDLEQALNQRHYHNEVETWPEVEEFWKNAHKEEWRQKMHDKYLEVANGENVLELKEKVDWDKYMNGNNIDERIEESGIQDLWYKYALGKLGQISSVHNGIKAAAYQSLDQKHGFNTFYWDHDSLAENGDHGLIAATEQPTRNPEKTGQQENYTIETNYQVKQQIAKVAESNFFQGDTEHINSYVEHPAEHDYNNTSEEIGMYANTALQKSDSQDLWDRAKNISGELGHHFTDEWFHNPASEPAFDYFDRMNAVAYIAEENRGIVHHTRDELTYQK